MEDGEEGANDDNENENENDGENEHNEEGADGEGEGEGAAPAVVVTEAKTPAGSTPAPTTAKAAGADADTNTDAGAGTGSTREAASAGAAAVSSATDETHGIPLEIPANAIEMTNTAPGHVEDGSGDAGAGGPEFTQGHSHAAADAADAADAAGAEGGNGVEAEAGSTGGMEIDQTAGEVTADGAKASANANANADADPATGAPEVGIAPKEDAGLTMGEMEPVEVPELALPSEEEDKAMEAE